jgi:fatty-acyl-CoA synthase
MRPDKHLRARSLVRRWGLTPAAAYGLAAIRSPDRVAIVDDRGPLTFLEVDRRTSALAYALCRAAVDGRDTVAIMCRNHRWFVEASVACSKLAANIVYLDPSDGPASVAEVVRREDPRVLVYDEEFSELLEPVGRGRKHFIAWCDPDRPARCPMLEELIAREGSLAAVRPSRGGMSAVTLVDGSSGGEGLPARRLPNSLVVRGAAISKIPLRRGEVTVLAAPMFGKWGFLHFMLGLRLASTLVLPRGFDPVGVLEVAERHGASALAVLPETLRAIVELPEATSACYDLSALSVIAVQGPALASDLAIPAMSRFGDILYDLHGSSVVRLDGDWERQPPAAQRPPATGTLRIGAAASAEYAPRPGAGAE